MPSRIWPTEDPLTRALAPPVGETPEARQGRLREEELAKRVSDSIDEEINREKAEKKASKPIKILLLGQSESGKSTTLKNFQLMNSSKAFRKERASWKAVIQLNVVRSIRLILDVISEASSVNATADSSYGSRPASPIAPIDLPRLTPELLKLKLRLAPLISVEEVIIKKLCSNGSNAVAHQTNLSIDERLRFGKELTVHSSASWKGVFNRFRAGGRDSIDSSDAVDSDGPDDPGLVLNACAGDMIQLWNDPVVNQLLAAHKIRLEDMPGFFLDSIERVTALKYVPSDDDILRSRLKTVGVTEYWFKMSGAAALSGSAANRDWKVYDVGGQRSLRAAWVPFFDDMDAIIFLAPISCFDQVLLEDMEVNRLEDSILLWKSIVSNPLLKYTNLVLFLNKCDILKSKLNSGTRFSDYILSYGDRPNDYQNVTSYLKSKFRAIMKESSPIKRTFYCNFTSVTNTKSTIYILNDVQDMILRQSLKNSHLMQ